jgi:hypothetical protein
VGAALVLPTVGRPGVLDVAGATEDGVAAGALVAGCEVVPVGALEAVLVLGAEVEDGAVGAVLRARPDVGATDTGATTTPVGFVVSAVEGCTLR